MSKIATNSIKMLYSLQWMCVIALYVLTLHSFPGPPPDHDLILESSRVSCTDLQNYLLGRSLIIG